MELNRGYHSMISRRGGRMSRLFFRHPESRRRRRISLMRSFATLRMTSHLLVFLLAVPAFADAPGVYAITGGTVHPVSGPEIPSGVVIIRDGLIEAVGANLSIP